MSIMVDGFELIDDFDVEDNDYLRYAKEYLLLNPEPENIEHVKKKLPGANRKSPRSGKPMTGLVGVGNAASRMALKQRLTKTSEKS